MVDCPFILRKPSFAKATKDKKRGISITELLIVIAVLAVLMVVFLAAFKPWTQQAKARDSRRKSDLQKLKNPLEDYYNDNNCYPESLQDLVDGDYIGEEPKDPDTGDYYEYYRLEDDCDKYWIYTKLEWQQDSEIVEVGCGVGCGPGGDAQTDFDLRCVFSYGVSSPGENLECCAEKCAGGRPWDGGPSMGGSDCDVPLCGVIGCCAGPTVDHIECYGTEIYCCPPEE